MSLPPEIISKIMLYHSNIRFDKNELIDFVKRWDRLECMEERGEPCCDIEWDFGAYWYDWHVERAELLENNIVYKFWIRKYHS